MPFAKLTVVTVEIKEDKLIWFATVSTYLIRPKKLTDSGAIT